MEFKVATFQSVACIYVYQLPLLYHIAVTQYERGRTLLLEI